MMSKWSKKYDPHQHEPGIYRQWEESGAFKPNSGQPFDRQKKKPFTVMLPLPNVTGSLHMGHALQHAITDVLVRYHRMKGEPTLWQPGTDHAGIATQNVVEKDLRRQGISRHDLGREDFLKKIWQWRDKYGGEIISQMKRMGSTCDWSRLVFTMDDSYVRAVQEAFTRYFRQGYVYRGNRIVNWCPRCMSVISDLEINRVKQETKLYTLKYPYKDGSGDIKVATTRPETMLGDTAVAVHPADERYKQTVGREVRLPLTDRIIEVVADDRVEPDFGTGAVKVTPAHDLLDAEIGKTHNLETINVIGEDGKMTAEAGDFAGKTSAEAREVILAALEEEGWLQGVKPYRHTITLCDRCGTPIEPLVSRQWFVDMAKLKDETIMVAEQELVQFLPPRWKKNFLDWMENVHDWTISRQLWWGQRIPVWWQPGTRGTEREEGNYVVARERPTRGEWEQDPDVFDTWFSSALWPLVTLGWPDSSEDLKTFYPTSVLITARDILYLWVARMIFSGLNFTRGQAYGDRMLVERVPFAEVYIHATVLTKTGQRMSKSLGTGVDPLELVNKYGADATRFGLLWRVSYDRQAIRFDEKNIKAARNFANKVWNIARLLDGLEERRKKSLADGWIRDRLARVEKKVTDLLEEYKVGEAARVTRDFLWRDYADWYVEILKVEGSTKVAREVLRQALVLLHPFMPYITERLWSGQSSDHLLITQAWPERTETDREKSRAEREMAVFQKQVNAVRSARVLMDIPAAEEISLFSNLSEVMPVSLERMCRAKLTSRHEPTSDNALVVPVTEGKYCIIYAAAISAAALEKVRLKISGEIKELEGLIAKQRETLAKMEDKAPARAVKRKQREIDRIKAKLDEARDSLELTGK